MQRNAELLRAVGDRIAANPHLYDQSEWGLEVDCGTVGCVAGHAVDLADGYEIDYAFASHGTVARLTAGGRVATQVAARDALGLDQDEASVLFAGSWRPVGWKRHDDYDLITTAPLVRDALYRLADGASLYAVSEQPIDAP